MTREGFDRYAGYWQEKGIPFSAYWWPRGYSMIRTGEWTEPAHIDPNTHKMVRERKRQVSKSTLSKWIRLRDKLRKSGCYVVTVEFDGQHLAVEE